MNKINTIHTIKIFALILVLNMAIYSAEFSGQITNENNRGIYRVSVSAFLTVCFDDDVFTRTNQFGYFYAQVRINCGLLVIPYHPRYSFEPPVRLLQTPEPNVRFTGFEKFKL